MGYRFREGAPEVNADKLGEWLPRIFQATESALGVASEQTISEGYPVIFPTLEEIAAGKLSDDNAVSWRYLIFSGDEALGELEINDARTPIAFHQGRAKDGLVAALKKARSLSKDYFATVVISPALKLTGLWLRQDNDDLFIPFPPNATKLTPYEPVALHTALDVLRPVAQRLLSTNPGTSGG